MIQMTETKEWSSFSIDDIAIIKPGKRLTKANMSKGLMPFIGASDSNNGITEFVGNTNESEDSNVLGVNYNGSVAENFYHPYKAIFTDDVKRLSLKKVDGNKFLYLFLKNSILMQKSKYQYAYKFNEVRLKRQKILLPINEKEEPDYEFMEQYVKSIFDKKLNHYKKYALNALKALTYIDISSLEDIEWKEFDIGGKQGLFDISSTSSSIDKNKLVISDDGDIPYITRTDMNNGINQFVKDNQNPKYLMDEGNVITIGLDTQTVFYQPHKFFTGQNIQVLRHQKLNKHTALFLIPLIKVQMEKFNWGGNGATLGRLSRTKIMLPVNSKGEPDWVFMGQYSKNLEYTKIKQYLKFLENQDS